MKKIPFKIIQNEEELDLLIKYCKQTKYVCIDFETTSLQFQDPKAYPTILGVSFQIGSAWVIPLGHYQSPFKTTFPSILQKFSLSVLQDPEITKIAWNAKFEEKWLIRYGCKITGRLFDGMLGKYLLNEERPHDLKSVVSRLIPELSGYENKIEGLVKKHGWEEVPLKDLAEYCAIDCHAEFLLMTHIENKLIKGGFYKLFRNLYMPRSRGLAECEYAGALIDKPYLEKLMAEYEQKIRGIGDKIRDLKIIRKYERKFKKSHIRTLIKDIQDEITDIREEDAPNAPLLIRNRETKIQRIIQGELSKKETYEGLNFASPKQMINLLFLNKYGFRFKIVKYTVDKHKKETETPSTDEEVLLVLQKKDKSGFIKALLELRGLEKLYSTYIKGIYEILDQNNRVHPNFKLHGTVTGRLCISDKGLLKTDIGDVSIKDFCPRDVGVRKQRYTNKVLTHTGEYRRILYGINKGQEEMYEIELESGAKIECTIGHRFLTDKGWVTLKTIMHNTNGTIYKILSYEN